MENLKKPEISESHKKIALVIIAAVFFIYLDMAFILKSQFKAIKAGAGKSRELKSTLKQFESDSANLFKLENDVKILESDRGKLDKQITSELEIANLLDGISEMADNHDVKIMQIKPSTLDAEKEKGKVGNSGFYGIGIAMELRSSYHKLGEFLSSLESNPFIGINSIKISYNTDLPAYHKVSLNLKVYVKKNP